MAPSEKDKRHADLLATFVSNLAVAFVAGAFLQALLPDLQEPARTAMLLVTGFALLGVSHIVIERSYGEVR